tara:strand:+ start:118 stop:477 length:360 start_codon:yes stop_codon:yes gene_type:complete
MKRLLALALPLLALAGCEIHAHECHYHNDVEHCHSAYHHSSEVTTNTYYGEDTTTTNIILVEEEYYPTCDWGAPYSFEANWCSFDDITCCAWDASYTTEHVYCYYDYCGWDLVEINEYY